jgi:class I lanthipeptide synthase
MLNETLKSPSPWRPLLAGEEAAEALRVVEEIAGAIAAKAAEGAPDAAAGPGGRGASLAGGNAGHALFFDYAAQALGRDDYADLAAQCLDRAIGAVAAEPMSYGLYSGFAGIAWVAEHLQARAPASPEATPEAGPAGDAGAGESPADAEDGDDLNEEIDAALLDLLARRPWRDTYDLIGGLVGLGVYALERLPRPSAAACLAAVVDQLAETSETAEIAGGGVTWFTPPELLGPWGQEATPNGCYNLGVAHGVPAILPLLAAACRAGVREERAAALLEGAVSWLLAQADRTGEASCFPTSVAPGVASPPARLAWCYGDAGVAATLLGAARLAGREDWEEEALAVARRAAERPVERSGAKDAGLCHGHFGLAHVFNRLHQATGDERFAEVARVWYREGLAFRRPGQGIAGYASWDAREGELSWTPDSGFLTGIAGIGLALLAAVTPQEPAWDRVLLVNVPPAIGAPDRARAERDS